MKYVKSNRIVILGFECRKISIFVIRAKKKFKLEELVLKRLKLWIKKFKILFIYYIW